MLHTHHRTDFVDAVTAGVDHDLAIDVALFGVHSPCVVFVLGQASDGRVTIHFGPCLASTPRKRLTQRSRIDIAVVAIPKTAQQIVGGNQRMTAGTFGRIKNFEFDTHATGHRCKMPVAIHLRRTIGKPNAPVPVVILHGVIGIIAQLFIQVNRMRL